MHTTNEENIYITDIEDLNKNQLQNFLSHADISNMNKDQLTSLFYEYINKTEYLSKRNNLITRKVQENNHKRSKDLSKLEKKYKSFYFNNLSVHEHEAKKKMEKRKEFRSNLAYKFINEGMIKFIYLFAIIYLPIITILAHGYLTYPNHAPGDTGFFEIAIPMTITIFLAVLVAYIPVKWIVQLMEKPIIPIVNVLSNLISKGVINKARYEDISSAKKKGITKDNIKEVFKYNDIEQEINNSYNGLETKIRSWNKAESFQVRDDLTTLGNIIPMRNKQLDHMFYIYDQLSMGANESWKECINDLKLQLRHKDITNEIKNVCRDIRRSNDLLVDMNNNLNRSFSRIENMISSEMSAIDSRLDGFFETVYNDPYGLYYY